MKHQKIWNKVLAEYEQVKYEFGVSDRYRYLAMLLSIAVCGPIIWIIGNATYAVVYILAVLFYFGFYSKVAFAYAFTDKQVIMHEGWLNTKMVATDFHKITDVTVEESFMGRHLYKCGNLYINTAGQSNKEIILKYISEPYEVKKRLDVLLKNRG